MQTILKKMKKVNFNAKKTSKEVMTKLFLNFASKLKS